MGERRVAYRGLVGKPEEKQHLEDTHVDGRIILKWIFWNWDGGMGWIDLVQDRDRLRISVNAVMNFRFP
jgi:hypothetical protein